MSERLQRWPSLLVCFAVTFGAAAFGSQFLPGTWYENLAKPVWNPPNWIFGPVWTILYVLIAVAAWMVWRRSSRIGWALAIWAVQLCLNAVWSWIFFGLQRPGAALFDIVVLLAAIVATASMFFRIDRVAGLLLIPYVLWVGFAALLNFTIWRLNS